MINKLAESHVRVPVEFPSMCESQLFTLKTEIYLVLPSSPSDGQASAPAFVTHRDELSTLSKHPARGNRSNQRSLREPEEVKHKHRE